MDFFTLYTKSVKEDSVKSDESYKDEITIRKNIDYILSHFENQHELFPHNIMTSKTGGQIKIEYESDVQKSKDKIFDYFKQASFIDCKINAFPYNTEYTLDLEVKNRTAASFIMIDLDLKDFSDKEKLDKQLKKTLKNMQPSPRRSTFSVLMYTKTTNAWVKYLK